MCAALVHFDEVSEPALGAEVYLCGATCRTSTRQFPRKECAEHHDIFPAGCTGLCRTKRVSRKSLIGKIQSQQRMLCVQATL